MALENVGLYQYLMLQEYITKKTKSDPEKKKKKKKKKKKDFEGPQFF